jgi:BlaI family penicillinase repressor
MQALWQKGRASAREITDTLNEYEPIAHSTVQTLLRTLEIKGAVAHDEEDRTFMFYPLVKNERVIRNAMREFIDRVFNGSAEGLVSYLVRSGDLTPEEMRSISDLFLTRVFGGSVESLVSYLVQNNYITPEALRDVCERAGMGPSEGEQ